MHSPRPAAATSLPVAIVGAACRLPGAADTGAFWDLLKRGGCSVTGIGPDRWHRERFFHPRMNEAGFSYSFAAGVIDNPFAFDPAAFGISPREAEQMDPQQRLLLELVWEALEDAGIPPSTLHGSHTGVYVGASSLDYGSRQMADPAAIDAHFMSGNTLSIVANRISYIYGLNGPSLTVDTACSSSLVALNQAMLALESGVIDTAIVAGVNILMSPVSFIGFSRAGMLSPTGLCRPFSAKADGYVRAEGGVVLVLRADSAWRSRGEQPCAMIVASAVNSDGRTSGMTLPSAETQARLLDGIYRGSGVEPDDLAFVEAHGTGTRVGDPAEAQALGRALGQRRGTPLPIGSVKSNIGHLEPASGLAGLLKAMLALKHRHLPASLHLGEPSADIAFGELNLAPALVAADLSALAGPLYAGVSSFGFGGTNAHVVLREADPPKRSVSHKGKSKGAPELLVISAQSQDALRALAADYSRAVVAHSPADLAIGTARRRDLLPHRLALPLGTPQAMADMLARHARGERVAGIEAGRAPASDVPVAFVYSGNGAQWPGMGRAAYASSSAFRDQFGEIDTLHRQHAGWSLADMLLDTALPEKIERTSIAQPLLFAIQSALTATLADLGLRPDAVLGHSVGEIAAAEACGALTRPQAVALIHRRSQAQEHARGSGLMMAVKLSVADAERFLAGRFADLEIAAINSPDGVTLAGPAASIRAAERAAREAKIVARIIAVDYPFHSRLLDPHQAAFMASMTGFSARAGAIPFLSAVTGEQIDGAALDADYWWRNIRAPVRFSDAVQAAAALGCRTFIEIGPRPILLKNITETLAAIPNVTAVASFDGAERVDGPDPVRGTLARAVTHGARVDRQRVLGRGADRGVILPHYPWQRVSLRVPASPESVDILGLRPRHPLIGARLTDSACEWRTTLDAAVVPYLADHKVDGDVVMPAAGFAEMALAAARDWLGDGPLMLEDFDIVHGMVFAENVMREVAVRLEPSTQVLDICSRPRLAADWTLHARCRVGRPASRDEAPAGPVGDIIETDGSAVYACAARFALDYGPAFRLVTHTRRDGDVMAAELSAGSGGPERFGVPHVLSPATLDAAFHGLFLLQEPDDRRTCLPVRIGALRVHSPGAAVSRAMLRIDAERERSFSATIALLGGDGSVVAVAEGVRFQWATLKRTANVFFRTLPVCVSGAAVSSGLHAALDDALARETAADVPEDWLLLLAFARSLAHRAMRSVMGEAPAPLDSLVDGGALASSSVPLAAALLETLAGAGLASEDNGVWTLKTRSGLPEPELILRTFAADHPGRAAELAMAARALQGLAPALKSGAAVVRDPALAGPFEAESLLVAPAIERMRTALDRLTAAREAPMRVLLAEPGAQVLLRVLLPLLREGRMVITVAGDGKRLAELQNIAPQRAGIDFAELDSLETDRPFDLALALGVPSTFGGDRKLGRAVARALHDRGALLVVQPMANPVADTLLGATAGWFAHSRQGMLPGEDELRAALVDAEFESISIHAGPVPAAALVLAHPRVTARAVGVDPAPVLLVGPSAFTGRLASSLAGDLKAGGRPFMHLRSLPEDREACAKVLAQHAVAGAAIEIVYAVVPGAEDVSAALCGLILRLAGLTEALRTGQIRARVWLMMRDDRPAEATAARALARVAINEYPDLDIRLLDLSPELDATAAAQGLTGLFSAAGSELEFQLDRRGHSVARAVPGLADVERPSEANAGRLHFAPPDSSHRLEWRAEERSVPADGEVEIEVAATGLNFRDVMLASGLLPDDLLADGYAGSELGLECAGRISRVGRNVTELKVGDPVASFARAAFATHVTVPAALTLPLPPTLPLEAAAGMPVAFLTAWYGLVHLAKLKRNEWVLIHAAAGGVGLAALQVARWRGARVVATAGSEDKRALVRLFGAEMVLDSRSQAFADEIRKSIGGVDVVLNSLAGEAMLDSLKVLKPFGRFVELGKRDYAANSRLGLRPFRQNLTYYGVDVDQLLTQKPTLARKLGAELARRFVDGTLSPLPYRVMDSDRIDDAMKAMQRAAHVGKIVVRPPAAVPPQRIAGAAFAARPEGCHLVIGGTSGFGFETARWLAERGARTIVVASRRGAIAPETEEAADALRARGVDLIAAHVDVSRRDSVDWLVNWIESQHGPLVGVVHAAMVLGDGALSSLDKDKIAAVLAPKVDGARNLDQATRHASLDYFVMYSSATTLIGNPGQASYVAANGYLEGLARQRRAEGLPALAVAWGPIADAGVLARNAAAGSRLARRTGSAGLKSADALACLGRLLAAPDQGEPVVVCASIDWSAASRELKILKSPMFSLLRPAAAEENRSAVDMAELLKDKTESEVRTLIADRIAAQVAAILRIAASDLDPRRPLSEIGMDSLMGLELKMAMEERFGIEVPLIAMRAGKSVADIAAHLAAELRPSAAAEREAGPAALQDGLSLLAQHAPGVVAAEVEEMEELAKAVDQRRKTMKGFSG